VPAVDPGSVALEALEPLSLEGDRGERVRLRDLWRERPALLAFLRHFG
jgi:hypothetical protein